ncbi:MAG: protein kinase [Phycisphaera sp.]|nr:protein kinase [Phycisphaera sp.]
MSFEAERVDQIACRSCGLDIDARRLESMSVISCPRCKAKNRVPVKIGNLIVDKPLGQGTAGIVFRAFDPVLKRRVAVKVLKGETKKGDPGSEQRVRKILNEARAMAAINHPNVVKIHKISTHQGTPYIEMEFLSGGSVKDLVKRHKRLPEADALQIAIDCAKGLKAAHASGLVHRDVKPENMLLTEEGDAKLLDFGVAQFRENSKGKKKVVGTPYYVAPEVVKQEAVDHRSDIYSLGCTLFYMLCGRPPFDAESVTAVYMARLKHPAPQVRQFNKEVTKKTNDVLVQMLRRNPEDRYPQYDNLIRDLEKAMHLLKQDTHLLTASTVASLIEEPDDEFAQLSPEERIAMMAPKKPSFIKQNLPLVLFLAIVIALILLGVGIGLMYMNK